MSKIVMEISYDGTDYAGFQRQPDVRTIQAEIERALEEITHQPTIIYGSGRTDAGVHAYGQVIHFTAPTAIPLEKWPLAMKSHLPPDIVVRRALSVEDRFHARYDAIGKTYRYIIDRGRTPDVFWRKYAYHYPIPLQLERIQQAIPHFIGTYDFTAFSASGTSVGDKVRSLYSITIEEADHLLYLTYKGNGFLYNMVRILTGTLLAVGVGKIAPQQIPAILAAKNRKMAGNTAPPHGLYLMKVDYPERFLKNN